MKFPTQDLRGEYKMCRSKVYLMIVGLCFLAGIANAANEATDPFPVDGQEGIETANRLLMQVQTSQ